MYVNINFLPASMREKHSLSNLSKIHWKMQRHFAYIVGENRCYTHHFPPSFSSTLRNLFHFETLFLKFWDDWNVCSHN